MIRTRVSIKMRGGVSTNHFPAEFPEYFPCYQGGGPSAKKSQQLNTYSTRSHHSHNRKRYDPLACFCARERKGSGSKASCPPRTRYRLRTQRPRRPAAPPCRPRRNRQPPAGPPGAAAAPSARSRRGARLGGTPTGARGSHRPQVRARG